jgi:hypothetical protein
MTKIKMPDIWADGNWWISLDDAGRFCYITGFNEGVSSVGNYLLYSLEKFQETKDLINKAFKAFNEAYIINKEGIYEAEVDFLDKFYSISQYRTIRIEKALKWFYLSASGKIPVKEIDDRATEMLKFDAEIHQRFDEERNLK